VKFGEQGRELPFPLLSAVAGGVRALLASAPYQVAFSKCCEKSRWMWISGQEMVTGPRID
jgi:hypothetical protein